MKKKVPFQLLAGKAQRNGLNLQESKVLGKIIL